MTIKGTCEAVNISFEIKSNNKALATKMLLSECLFIKVINNIAYYTTSDILEISEDISKENNNAITSKQLHKELITILLALTLLLLLP